MAEFLRHWFDAGGPIVVFLALLSIASVALIAGKATQLARLPGSAAYWREAVTGWRAGRRADALSAVHSGRTPVERVLRTAMRGLEAGAAADAVREAAEHHGNREIAHLGRHVRTLEMIAAASPLIGLLGTVLGMIEAFRELELAAGSANATVLAGGIWQALLTTAMGLLVAIPAAVAATLIPGRVERVAEAIEEAVERLLSPLPADAAG